MTAESQNMLSGDRVCWLDNLRTFMVFVVVLCHASGVYESSGTWASFWIVDDPATNNLAGIFFLIADIFVMPMLFFISGYVAPSSVSRKTDWGFLKAKFKRLMIPWLIAVLTLIPLYKIIFLSSRHLPQENWTSYFHWSNGMWSQNWLWFLPVLFLFNVAYLLLSKCRIAISTISVKWALAGSFLIGFVYCLGMDLYGLRGWTKTVLLDCQNERLLIYFLAFLLGTLSFTRKVFEARPTGKLLYIVINALAWVPITAYIFFLLYPWFSPGNSIVSPVLDRAIVWVSYLLSLLCLMYVSIETFRRYQDRSGTLRNAMNSNSYSVYIIHVIVLGCLAWILLGTAVPSLWKYFILTISTFVVSNVVVSLYRTAARNLSACLRPVWQEAHSS